MRPGTLIAVLLLIIGLVLMLSFMGDRLSQTHEKRKQAENGEDLQKVQVRVLNEQVARLDAHNRVLSASVAVVVRERDAVTADNTALRSELTELRQRVATLSATPSATKPEKCDPGMPPFFSASRAASVR